MVVLHTVLFHVISVPLKFESTLCSWVALIKVGYNERVELMLSHSAALDLLWIWSIILPVLFVTNCIFECNLMLMSPVIVLVNPLCFFSAFFNSLLFFQALESFPIDSCLCIMFLKYLNLSHLEQFHCTSPCIELFFYPKCCQILSFSLLVCETSATVQ